MVRLLLPIVLLLLGVGAGIGAGLMLGGDAPPENATADTGTEPEADSKPDETAPTPKDPAEIDISAIAFVKLSNQFIVPVLTDGTVEALVVVSLSLEVDATATEEVLRIEPKLRDRFLRVMFDHSNVGGFNGSFTEAATMQPLRKALLETAQSILGEVVKDVLIVDLVRRDT